MNATQEKHPRAGTIGQKSINSIGHRKGLPAGELHHNFPETLWENSDFDPIDELVEVLRAAEFEGKGSQP